MAEEAAIAETKGADGEEPIEAWLDQFIRTATENPDDLRRCFGGLTTEQKDTFDRAVRSLYDDSHLAAPSLIAYFTGPADMRIVPAPRNRDWMDKTQHRSAYRCLPMVIANRAGWLVLNAHKFAATWDGGTAVGCIQIEYLEPHDRPQMVASHFGSGVLDWFIPYVFRTLPGVNLLVRGPSNWPKDGMAPLEGVVETDWAYSTFSMNWKMIRPNCRIVFEAGEPIAMVVPQPRGQLETFHPEIRDIRSATEILEGFAAWNRSRQQFYQDMTKAGSDAEKSGYQKHYLRGITVDGRQAEEHQTKLSLDTFADRRR